MSDLFATTVIFLFVFYLISLGVISFVAPARATRFLLGFVGSAFAHYFELTIRFLVGAAFLLQAPDMRFSGLFEAFGWIIIVTTAGLLTIPWRWHHRFAQWSVPYAIRHLRLVGSASFMFGGLIFADLIGAMT